MTWRTSKLERRRGQAYLIAETPPGWCLFVVLGPRQVRGWSGSSFARLLPRVGAFHRFSVEFGSDVKAGEQISAFIISFVPLMEIGVGSTIVFLFRTVLLRCRP